MFRTVCYRIWFINFGQYEIDLDIEEHGDEYRSHEIFGSHGMPKFQHQV